MGLLYVLTVSFSEVIVVLMLTLSLLFVLGVVLFTLFILWVVLRDKLRKPEWCKKTKEKLAKQLRAEIYPELLRLGFEPPDPENRRYGRFSLVYSRDRGIAFDSIYFDWFRYAEPSFSIGFDRQTNPEVIKVFRKHYPQQLPEMPYDFHFHLDTVTCSARMEKKWGGRRSYFGIFPRWKYWFGREATIDQEIDKILLLTHRRINQIDDWLQHDTVFAEMECSDILKGLGVHIDRTREVHREQARKRVENPDIVKEWQVRDEA